MQQSFDSYVQPPRPGAAPRPISHDARRRPPRTTANPPTTSPGQRGTTPPPTAHHRAHSRSAVVLLATVLAHATQGRTDAAGPPGLPEWPTTPPPADIADHSTNPPLSNSAAAPSTTTTDTPVSTSITTATVLSVATTIPTATPLAIEMTANPVRSHRRGKPAPQMVNFDSCSGASFAERKWLTSIGCKLQAASSTLHFHGFCDSDAAANTTSTVADVQLSRGAYSKVYRVWVVDDAPVMCLIGRDGMSTARGHGTTLRPCTEHPTMTFDGHEPFAAYTDPDPDQPAATTTTTAAATFLLSTSEGISIPGATLGTEFIRTPTTAKPGTDLFVTADRHGSLRVADQVVRVDNSGYAAVLVHNTSRTTLNLPPGSAVAHAQPIAATPLHPATVEATAAASTGVLFAETKPASSEAVRGSAWKGRQFNDHDEAVESFSDNVPHQRDLDAILQRIANNAQAGNARQRKRLLSVLRKHAQQGLFSTQEAKTGHVKGSEVSFKFNSDKPIYIPQYPMNPIQEAEVIRQVKAMEKEGLVHKTTSGSNFPLLLIEKSHGKAPRVCLDLRALNSSIIAQHFAMPRIDTLVDDMARSTLFSAIDCTAGYSMLRLATDDQAFPTSERAAFTLPRGQGRYAMSVLTMGVSPAMFVFQAAMHKILNEHCSAGYLANYVDDAVIHSGSPSTDEEKNVEQHINYIDAVFTSLSDAGIKLGAHKTTCLQTAVDALGCHIENNTVGMSTEKAKAIDALQVPDNRAQLQTAMGLLGITRRFMPNFAHTSACLFDLMHAPGRTFDWTPVHDTAFNALKERLATTAPLAATNWKAGFEVHADASDTACGGALLQRGPDGLPVVLEFFSHKFTPQQRRYTVSEREALALVLACKRWRPFLLADSRFKVLLKTDHRGLVYLARCSDVNSRLWRWMNELSQYNYDIEYIRGTDNKLPDALSRLTLLVRATADMIQTPPAPLTTSTATYATTTTTTQAPLLHNIERLIAPLKHHNTGPALWFRVRWSGYAADQDTVEQLKTLKQDVGPRTMKKLRARLATSPTAAADAALPLPAGFSGFTATGKPAGTHTAQTNADTTAAAAANHDAVVLDTDAGADTPPATDPHNFSPHLLSTTHLLPNFTPRRLAQLQRKDKHTRSLWDDTKRQPPDRKHPDYYIHKGLLMRHHTPKHGPRAGHKIDTIVLPEGKLIRLALAATHDQAGHHGQHATLFAMQSRFSFRHLRKRTIDYVAGCALCGRSKRDLRPVQLGKIPVVPSFGAKIAIDFAGPLFESGGGRRNRHLCIMVCTATKWVHVVPVPDVSATSATAALLDFAYHNTIPREITSDRGSGFCNTTWRGLMRSLGCKHRPTVAYNPQGNSMAEAMVKQVKALIARAAQRHPRHWDTASKWAAYSYNCSWNATLNSTPYYCKHGREPTTPADVVFSTSASDSLTLSQLVDRINDVHKTTQANIAAMHKRVETANKKMHRTRTFSKNDECWLSRVYPGRNAAAAGGLNRSFFFPFRPDIYTIIDNLSTQHVKIKNNRTNKTQIVHTRRLKPCRPQDEAFDISAFHPQAEVDGNDPATV